MLGFADAGHVRPVALRVADSFHHVHVLGPNGTGKSTLLAQMILSDIQAGHGVAVVDAKGDLVTDLLGLIPEEAGERIALIDPDDRHPRPALNVLSGPDRETLADNLVGIFHKIYADSWGPRSTTSCAAAPSPCPATAEPSPTSRPCSPIPSTEKTSPNGSTTPSCSGSGTGTSTCPSRPRHTSPRPS